MATYYHVIATKQRKLCFFSEKHEYFSEKQGIFREKHGDFCEKQKNTSS